VDEPVASDIPELGPALEAVLPLVVEPDQVVLEELDDLLGLLLGRALEIPCSPAWRP
jgi:hypothetical protein